MHSFSYKYQVSVNNVNVSLKTGPNTLANLLAVHSNTFRELGLNKLGTLNTIGEQIVVFLVTVIYLISFKTTNRFIFWLSILSVATSSKVSASDIAVKSRDAIKLNQERHIANSVISLVVASDYRIDCHQAVF